MPRRTGPECEKHETDWSIEWDLVNDRGNRSVIWAGLTYTLGLILVFGNL